MGSTQSQGQGVPEHVPAELVLDKDLYTFLQEGDDPYRTASCLHDGPDIFWARNAVLGQPAWVPTRHALMHEIYLNTEAFSSDRQNLAMLGVDWKLNPLEYDPPEHSKYRRILNPFFTPKAMSALDDSVKEVCNMLISKFAERGSCEFVTEFAEEFPSYIFLDLMGLPREKLHDFLRWERDMIHAKNAVDRVGAMKSVLAYFEQFIAEQKGNPTTELMKGILSAQVDDGRPLDDGEIMGMCYLLYIGGLDTVFCTLGWVIWHLATDQPLQKRLRENPEEIPKAVEEFLRAYPVATPHREVTKDINFHGVQMRAGEWVLLPTFLAARDPQAYDNPHTIDIDRKTQHITFANGPHVCLGRSLARRELITVIETFLSRFTHIRIPDGERYAYHTGGVFGVDRLPLEWDTAE